MLAYLLNAFSMDDRVCLSLTIVNQVSFLANMYAEGNKFYSSLLNAFKTYIL